MMCHMRVSLFLCLWSVWRLIGFMLFDFIIVVAVVVIATKESAIKRLTCTECAAGCSELGMGEPIKQFLINLKRKMQKKKNIS